MKQEVHFIRKWDPATDATRGYNIPASKSVLARDIMLLLREDKGAKEIQDHLRKRFIPSQISQDIETLLSALQTEKEHDCGESGTALRFLTTYFSGKKGCHLIKGRDRLKERPIEDLIKILEEAGIVFRFLERDYAVPFEIINNIGKPTYPKEIDTHCFPSSQYVSALLLAGCTSEIIVGEDFPSKPYLNLTLREIRRCGYDVIERGNRIQLLDKYRKTPQSASELEKVGDWSSAWYWIEHLLLQPSLGSVEVFGLALDSGQPDEELFHRLKGRFGLVAEEEREGVVFRKNGALPESGSELSVDISPYPDQFLTLACICAGLGINILCSGTNFLRTKESDRISSFERNIKALGSDRTLIRIEPDSVYLSATLDDTGDVILEGYNDHRVVMSFAVLSASPYVRSRCHITHPSAVAKSYPDFWSELYPATNPADLSIPTSNHTLH